MALSATILAILVPYEGLPSWGATVSVLALAVTYLAVIVCVGELLGERTRLVDELRAAHAAAEQERLEREAAAAEHDRETEHLQRQLIHTSKMSAVGELSAAVAHGVNNPLTGVLGYAELLLADLPQGDPRRGELEIIRNEALRARDIVRALVEFARPNDPSRTRVDLCDTVRAALDLVRDHFGRRGITLVDALLPVPPVDVDPSAIQQIVLNLCQNAVQAMPDGGDLRVSVLVDAGDAVVRVEDNGQGMDDSVAERAFQPFFTTRDASGANGLGLSVTRRLVEAHGGTIGLSSTPGVGTVVEVRIPLAEPQPPLPPLPPLLSASGTGAR
jgi:two-component system NtrC family sensor kinase